MSVKTALQRLERLLYDKSIDLSTQNKFSDQLLIDMNAESTIFPDIEIEGSEIVNLAGINTNPLLPNIFNTSLWKFSNQQVGTWINTPETKIHNFRDPLFVYQDDIYPSDNYGFQSDHTAVKYAMRAEKFKMYADITPLLDKTKFLMVSCYVSVLTMTKYRATLQLIGGPNTIASKTFNKGFVKVVFKLNPSEMQAASSIEFSPFDTDYEGSYNAYHGSGYLQVGNLMINEITEAEYNTQDNEMELINRYPFTRGYGYTKNINISVTDNNLFKQLEPNEDGIGFAISDGVKYSFINDTKTHRFSFEKIPYVNSNYVYDFGSCWGHDVAKEIMTKPIKVDPKKNYIIEYSSPGNDSFKLYLLDNNFNRISEPVIFQKATKTELTIATWINSFKSDIAYIALGIIAATGTETTLEFQNLKMYEKNSVTSNPGLVKQYNYQGDFLPGNKLKIEKGITKISKIRDFVYPFDELKQSQVTIESAINYPALPTNPNRTIVKLSGFTRRQVEDLESLVTPMGFKYNLKSTLTGDRQFTITKGSDEFYYLVITMILEDIGFASDTHVQKRADALYLYFKNGWTRFPYSPCLMDPCGIPDYRFLPSTAYIHDTIGAYEKDTTSDSVISIITNTKSKKIDLPEADFKVGNYVVFESISGLTYAKILAVTTVSPTRLNISISNTESSAFKYYTPKPYGFIYPYAAPIVDTDITKNPGKFYNENKISCGYGVRGIIKYNVPQEQILDVEPVQLNGSKQMIDFSCGVMENNVVPFNYRYTNPLSQQIDASFINKKRFECMYEDHNRLEHRVSRILSAFVGGSFIPTDSYLLSSTGVEIPTNNRHLGKVVRVTYRADLAKFPNIGKLNKFIVNVDLSKNIKTTTYSRSVEKDRDTIQTGIFNAGEIIKVIRDEKITPFSIVTIKQNGKSIGEWSTESKYGYIIIRSTKVETADVSFIYSITF